MCTTDDNDAEVGKTELEEAAYYKRNDQAAAIA